MVPLSVDRIDVLNLSDRVCLAREVAHRILSCRVHRKRSVWQRTELSLIDLIYRFAIRIAAVPVRLGVRRILRHGDLELHKRNVVLAQGLYIGVELLHIPFGRKLKLDALRSHALVAAIPQTSSERKGLSRSGHLERLLQP